MPHFDCLHCAQPLEADDTMVGTQVACPGCAQVITVPHASPYQTMPRDPFHSAPPAARKSRPSGKASFTGPLIATLVAFVAGFVNSIVQTHFNGLLSMTAGALGYALAAAIIAALLALVLAGILAAFGKPFAATLARAYTAAVVVLAGLGLLGQFLGPMAWRPAASPAEVQNVRETVERLQADVKKVNDMTNSSGPGGWKAPPLKFESEIQGSSTLDKMARLTRQMMTEMAAVKQTYDDELDRAGIVRLLSAPRIAEDSGFRESRAMLVRIKKAALDYKEGAQKVMTDFPQKIKTADLSAKDQATFLLNYEKGMVEAGPRLQETLDLEIQTVEIMTSIIEFLESRRPHWQAINGKFMFGEAQDLDRFNAYAASMDRNARRQAELQQMNQASTNARLNEMNALLPK